MMYKDNKDIKYRLDVKQSGDTVTLSFSADCGKHSTREAIDEYVYHVNDLLKLLEKNNWSNDQFSILPTSLSRNSDV